MGHASIQIMELKFEVDLLIPVVKSCSLEFINTATKFGFHKNDLFLNKLSNYWILKKNYGPWNHLNALQSLYHPVDNATGRSNTLY
jgi:hypothetical protein